MPSLEKKNSPPELEGGEDSEEAFAQGHEGGQQHHRVGGEVVRLEAVELQEGSEETARRQPQPAQAVRAEDDPLALLRRGGNLPLRRKTHPHVILAGEPMSPAEELDVVVVNFGAVPGAGAHRGRRGGRGRTHRELITAAFAGA